MERSEKEKQVGELKEFILGKSSVFLTDYRGMTVEQTYTLRRAFDKAGAGYRVVKNTLAKLAVTGTPYALLNDGLVGTTGLVVSNDPVELTKVLLEYKKKFDKLQLKYAYMEGSRLEPDQFDAVSKLPSKDDMRAQFLSVLSATASKFVSVLAAAPRDFVCVLSARQDALENPGA